MGLLTRVRDFASSFGDGPTVLAGDRQLWANTQTLGDLGELMARWLAGDIESQPGYYGPVDVDEEIAPGITDALVALNLAGFVTYNSQGAYDGPDYAASPWEAWVSGFANDATLDQLKRAVDGTRFRVHAGPPTDSRWWRFGPVGDLPSGGPMSRRELRWMYDVCGEHAIDAICDAWQITIYDPVAGSNDLWPVLAAAAVTR